MCRWDLAPDEALVMRGRIPPGVFVNVMLWNAHMQTLEYRWRRSSLNQAQIELETIPFVALLAEDGAQLRRLAFEQLERLGRLGPHGGGDRRELGRLERRE